MDDEQIEKLQKLFEDKYEKALEMSYQEWLDIAPQNETEAYARLQELDDELKATEDQYHEAEGDEKWESGEHREKLRNEYQLIEELFGLVAKDADW